MASSVPVSEMTPPPVTAERQPFHDHAFHAIDPTTAPHRPTDVVTRGLAAVALARTVGDTYRAAHALAIRLPRVRAVAILHRDDHGLLTLVYNPGETVLTSEAISAATVLHQRWIAAHAFGERHQGLPPVLVNPAEPQTIVPLVRGDALLGALLLVHDEGPPPDEASIVAMSLGALGVVVTQALANVVLRHRLTASISVAEHQESLADARRATGRELHDGPAQELALACLALDRQMRPLGEGHDGNRDARQARELVDRGIEGIRAIITGLRSRRNDEVALSVTGPLRALVAEMAPNAPELKVDFGGVSGVQLTPEVEQALVGIVREALHNVRKHAHADSVKLEVRRVDSAVEVAVIDDGVGFEGNSPPGHFGLEQIRELATETGGRVEIGSLPGEGTEVRAWIPLPNVAIPPAPIGIISGAPPHATDAPGADGPGPAASPHADNGPPGGSPGGSRSGDEWDRTT